MKRLLTTLFSVMVVLIAESFEKDGIYYAISSDNQYVSVVPGNTMYTSNWYSGNITIPSSVTYEGKTYPVTGIGYGTFNACTGLTSVSMPSTITYIGSEAFRGCTALTKLVIPNGVQEIGSSAFGSCSNIKSITIPNSVKTMGSYALSSCTALKEVSLSNNLTSIPDCLFAGDICLTSVDIPEGVTKIDEMAFSECSNLVSVKLPTTLTSIGKNAFVYCSSLTSITIPKNVTSIAGYIFNECTGLKDVYCYAENVPTAESIAFNGFNIANATLYVPAASVNAYKNTSPWSGFGTIKSIDEPTPEYIISGKCGDNVNYVLSNDYTLTISGTGAMYDYDSNTQPWNEYASQMKSVIIENGVTSIGERAFYACSCLTSVTIPNSVTSIGEEAFHVCSALTSVNITNIAAWCKIVFSGATSNPLSYAHHLYLDGREITDLVIPSGVTEIGKYAFYKWSGLTSVEIPNSVTSVGVCAFLLCSNLKSVTIPNSVTSIGEYAFAVCSGLTSVTIGNGMTAIKMYAFQDCNSLKDFYCYAGSVPTADGYTFYGSPTSSVTLHVPSASIDAYKAATPWSGFGTIIPIGENDNIYIETDVTANFPTDYIGWNGATGYTATQFAPMVTTNDGRTVQVCERFNGSSANTGTVFYRTLTGLTNGTYRIELYGAASSTKGRDSNISSDMTADDEGNETAVYLYAMTPSGTVKQYIPVHWATSFNSVATAVLNGVEVTDGTIEIGMFSDKKFTNWHVVQIKGVTALVDVKDLYANVLHAAQTALTDAVYSNVVGQERTSLAQAVRQYSSVSAQTAEAYQTAIDALVAATGIFTDAKESYDEWAYIKNLSYPYASANKRAAAEAAAAATPTDAADAVSMAGSMLAVFRSYAESSALLEGVEGSENVTDTYILNPRAEEGYNSTGWQVIWGEGSPVGAISIRTEQPWTDASGNSNHRYFDGGYWGAQSWDATQQQEVTLPAGHYQLTVLGRSSKDVKQTLFVGDNTVEMPRCGDTGGLFNRGWEQTSLEFELTETTTMNIGVRGITNARQNWMSFSDFRLVRFPDIKKCATPTISLVNGKLEFACDTEGVEFVSKITCPDPGEYEGSSIPLTTTYTVTVYAKKDGYEDSDVATAEINVGGGETGVRGDVNLDGEIGMPDVMFIVSYILNGKFPDEE